MWKMFSAGAMLTIWTGMAMAKEIDVCRFEDTARDKAQVTVSGTIEALKQPAASPFEVKSPRCKNGRVLVKAPSQAVRSGLGRCTGKAGTIEGRASQECMMSPFGDLCYVFLYASRVKC